MVANNDWVSTTENELKMKWNVGWSRGLFFFFFFFSWVSSIFRKKTKTKQKFTKKYNNHNNNLLIFFFFFVSNFHMEWHRTEQCWRAHTRALFCDKLCYFIARGKHTMLLNKKRWKREEQQEIPHKNRILGRALVSFFAVHCLTIKWHFYRCRRIDTCT